MSLDVRHRETASRCPRSRALPTSVTRGFDQTGSGLKDEWIIRAIRAPIQSDGRIRRWARISEFENRALRVILLADGETVHRAFFDRDFTGQPK